MSGHETQPWWSTAVFYQFYPQSFADSNGYGVGSLDGFTTRQRHLELLGIKAIWTHSVTVSPIADHSYDVADPRDIDPLFGRPAWKRVDEPDSTPGQVVSAPLRHRAARFELGPPEMSSTTSRKRCASGWDTAWMASTSMWPHGMAKPPGLPN